MLRQDLVSWEKAFIRKSMPSLHLLGIPPTWFSARPIPGDSKRVPRRLAPSVRGRTEARVFDPARELLAMAMDTRTEGRPPPAQTGGVRTGRA
jgi:hypothetical protein